MEHQVLLKSPNHSMLEVEGTSTSNAPLPYELSIIMSRQTVDMEVMTGNLILGQEEDSFLIMLNLTTKSVIRLMEVAQIIQHLLCIMELQGLYTLRILEN